MSRGASMDAISLDEWELLPDHKSSFFMEEFTSGHGTVGDEETKKPTLSIQPSEDVCVDDPTIKFKDIDVVKIESDQEEFVPKVTEIFDAEEEEMTKSLVGAKEVDEKELMVAVAPDQRVEDEEGVEKDRTGSEHNGFSVGKLRVNGVGALCSFGVAAATSCIFLLGGWQLLQKRQNQKNQFQMYGDNEVGGSFLIFNGLIHALFLRVCS
ncbi:hypothetical protein GUJ93_ZPchr0013g37932 [Zizania palustris]|uniref:DUF6821 domain-containing protein n=1 Tax=Zizania palustris TaxID=103762 RepID=A0A8J6BWN8_ZIZPA|nr:hypothetical protein GUJ93_ZPchr0013g37932 [Zizania palustris]KAG8098654.1 hypothetical protein GUJ93_ZPchr0013g37932 [Zizania palustris]